jgi:hypothetical protein
MKLNTVLGFFSQAMKVYDSPVTLGQLKAVLRNGQRLQFGRTQSDSLETSF